MAGDALVLSCPERKKKSEITRKKATKLLETPFFLPPGLDFLCVHLVVPG